MANLDDLRAQYRAADEANRKAYDALHGQFGTQNVFREYRIAKRDKNKEAIDRLKPQFEALNAAYNKTQEEKNRLAAELKKAETAEKTAKTTEAKAKGTVNTYKKAIEELAVASDILDAGGYQAQEKYVAAYQKAQELKKTLDAAGKKSVDLPEPKTYIPPAKTDNRVDGGAEGKDGKPPIELIGPFLDTIADPKNSALLIDIQTNLKKNFPNVYKGGIGGLKDWAATSAALNAINDARIALPASLRNTDFRTFLASPNSYSLISTSAGGTGGAKSIPFKSSETDAASIIQQTIKSELGRDATAFEISNLTKALNAYEAKNPRTTQGGYSTGSGVNQGEFIRQLITGQKNIKGLFNSKIDTQTIKDINQVLKGVTTEFTSKKGEAGKLVAQDLGTTLQANGLDKIVTQDQINAWTKRIQGGEKVDTIKNEIRMMAKTGMPDSVKKLLDAGNDLGTIYYPYKQAMASILELDPNSITLNDPTLAKAIGPNGEMPLYEYKTALRNDPRWQYTDNAKQTVSQGVMKVLKDFGFMG